MAARDLDINKGVIKLAPSILSADFAHMASKWARRRRPGPITRLGPVEMDFRYADYFGCTPRTGYERLLYDCMLGDQTLFQRADMVEAGWSVVQPLLDVWNILPPRTSPNNAAGSWGPEDSYELLKQDRWQWPDINHKADNPRQ